MIRPGVPDGSAGSTIGTQNTIPRRWRVGSPWGWQDIQHIYSRTTQHAESYHDQPHAVLHTELTDNTTRVALTVNVSVQYKTNDTRDICHTAAATMLPPRLPKVN